MTRSRHGPDPVSPAYPFPPAPYRTARLVLVEAAVPRPARAEKNETISASRRDDRRAGCHPCGWSRPADSADWTSTSHHTAWSGARRRAGGRKTARHETAAARGASNGFDDVPALEQRESAHPRAPGHRTGVNGRPIGRALQLAAARRPRRGLLRIADALVGRIPRDFGCRGGAVDVGTCALPSRGQVCVADA